MFFKKSDINIMFPKQNEFKISILSFNYLNTFK